MTQVHVGGLLGRCVDWWAQKARVWDVAACGMHDWRVAGVARQCVPPSGHDASGGGKGIGHLCRRGGGRSLGQFADSCTWWHGAKLDLMFGKPLHAGWSCLRGFV